MAQRLSLAAAGLAEDQDRASGLSGQISYRPLAAQPPLGDQPPAPQVTDCLASGANDTFGRILNRFAYCQEYGYTLVYLVSMRGVLTEIGRTDFTSQIYGQGDERQRRVRIFARIKPGSVKYRWDLWSNLWVAPNIELSLITNCVETNVQDCNATGGAATLKFVTWDNSSRWWRWDVYANGSPGIGRDRISFARWYLQFDTSYENQRAQARTEPRQIRCDSAAYFVRGLATYPNACVFNEVLPRLTYSRSDTGVDETARHIYTAQNTPDQTYPLLAPPGVPAPRSKQIPGKYTGSSSSPGLHRIREGVDPQYKTNGDHKDAACYGRGPVRAAYAGLGLPNPPVSGVEDCDEYPFASSLEGAASPDWDFSVRAETRGDNRRAGNRLGQFYTGDRILSYDSSLPLAENDQYWVEIL